MSSYPIPSRLLHPMDCELRASPGLRNVCEHIRREKEKNNKDKKKVRIETEEERLPKTTNKDK